MVSSVFQVLVHPTSESVLLDINPVCTSGSHATHRIKTISALICRSRYHHTKYPYFSTVGQRMKAIRRGVRREMVCKLGRARNPCSFADLLRFYVILRNQLIVCAVEPFCQTQLIVVSFAFTILRVHHTSCSFSTALRTIESRD